ncbi:MAG: ArnT family glycosyltransferase [Flavobacteriales bacterium]
MISKPNLVVVLFFVLNVLQAALTPLTGDEALYWQYWQHLDFGFRDHPPLIGLLIGMGDSLWHSELGARLLVVGCGSLTLWVAMRFTKPAVWWHFALLFFSIPVFTLYSFIATPDAPLLASTALYLWAWKNFTQVQHTKNALILGACMALMMWSKYHGLFIIIFTLLPLRKLWFNGHYWLAALCGVVLFSPHIVWQIVNDLPTVKFHLNDRNNDAMELKHILGYVGGQFGVFNPVVLCLAAWIMWRRKAQNNFERSMRWLMNGVLLLFFLNSMRGRVEPHWTAPVALAALYIIITHWRSAAPKRVVLWSLGVLCVLVLAARAILMLDMVPRLHKDKYKMFALQKVAGNLPVCFMNSYQNPSLYAFYTGGVAHSVNNIDGGKNQYDYWNYHEHIHEKPYLNVLPYSYDGFSDTIIDGFTFHVRKEFDQPLMHHLRLWTDEWLHEVHSGDTVRWPAWLINENNYAIQFCGEHTVRWFALMNHKKPNEAKADVELIDNPTMIAAGDSIRVVVQFEVPSLAGSHRLCFATQVDGLPLTYQSNWQRIHISP